MSVPAVASTAIGYLPAAVPVAAFAVTVTVLVEPAWMTTLAAWDCEPT